jgi:MFS family permease
MLRRLAIDLTPVRESREFRLLSIGETISNLGTQGALVALPYQIYVLSHSPALVGLLGAFELGPMVIAALIGGALNDRYDRRTLLALAQLAVISAAAALCVVALTGRPPVLLVLALGGLLAGGAALDGVSTAAIVPGILGPRRLRAGLALHFGLYQMTGIVGPALGGVMIEALGLPTTYGVDAASCLAMLAAAAAIGSQRPGLVARHLPVRRAIADGLRYVRANRALSGSYAIDLVAMTFGMPRALFAVLSLTVYDAGARGTGFLYAAVAAGGTLAVLTSGWAAHARRLGRIVIYAVVVWGVAIACAGLVRSLAPAMLLLGIAGWADGVSAVCRTTINQAIATDEMRGRVSAFHNLVVTSGPRLGDIESGLVASLTSALTSMLLGGLACVVGVGAIVLAFPQLAAFDVERAQAPAAPDPAPG